MRRDLTDARPDPAAVTDLNVPFLYDLDKVDLGTNRSQGCGDRTQRAEATGQRHPHQQHLITIRPLLLRTEPRAASHRIAVDRANLRRQLILCCC
jgi:hypothetical protein